MQHDSALRWTIFLTVGVGTLLIRGTFLNVLPAERLPPRIQTMLRFVPAAALAAIALPTAVLIKEQQSYHWSWERSVALAFAMLVAARTKNIFATLVSGMTALWLIHAGRVVFF